MLRFTRPGGVLAAATFALVVAACSSGAGGATNPPATSASGGAMTVDVKQGGPGAYLADANGKSLYIRTTDSANTTTCSGDCAKNWPPFVLQAGQTVQAGAGVTGTLASFTRPDGSTQVTLDGMPLYSYVGDTSAGQTNGQGKEGIWFLAAPAGGPVGGAAPSGGMPSATSAHRGY